MDRTTENRTKSPVRTVVLDRTVAALSGLDQVANEDEENEEIDYDEDMFGPEDGEDMINELDEDNDNFAYL